MDKLKGILEKNPNIGLDEDTIAVANSSFSNQTKRISLRGGVFRKIVGGKEVSTANSSVMDVIIIKMAHTPSRVYYKDSYEEGKRVSPVCWSNNSNKPDVEVRKPQAKSCYTCPNSVRGSGFGGVGTSCRISWRIAIVLANDPEGDILELVLPSNSCFGKEEKGNQAAQNAIRLTVYQVNDEEEREPVKFEAFEASDKEKAKVKTSKEAEDVSKIMDKWRK